jgi:membrane-associated phospholipid phosphatase/phytoene/squalene synthetase
VNDLRLKAALAIAFAGLWTVVYGTANWLTSLHTLRVPAPLLGETSLPFVPAAALLYLSLDPMMMSCVFIFRTWRGFVPLLVVLCAQTLIAGVFFVALPIENAFPPPSPAGPWAALFRLADFVNLDNNYLPSLHVSYAFTVALAIRRERRTLGGFFLLWALGIAVSTLLLHQHYVLDVVAGIGLAAGTMAWLHDRARAPGFLDAVRVEGLCLADFYRFTRRHRRYGVIAALLYRHSIPRWHARRAMRVAFCLLQHIDDLVDGDRPSAVEPLEIVDAVLDQMARDAFDETPLGVLGRCLWRDLAAFETGDDHPRAQVLALVRRMRFDRVRARDGLLLSSEDLRAHHRETFTHSVDLMLMLGGAALRARHAPDLIEALGWCSTIRDLRDDVEKGLVNIPAPVLEAARSRGLSAVRHDVLVDTPAVREWMREEHGRATAHLDAFETELAGLGKRSGVSVLRLFHRSIRRIADREARTHGWASPIHGLPAGEGRPAKGR